MAELLLGMLQQINNKINFSIIYKLLNDFLFAILIFFVLVMMAEGILMGIISRYIPLYLIILVMLVDIFAISLIGRSLKIEERKILDKKTTIFILVVVVLFLINSLLKISFYLIPIIVTASVIAIYFLYQVLIEQETNIKIQTSNKNQ